MADFIFIISQLYLVISQYLYIW